MVDIYIYKCLIGDLVLRADNKGLFAIEIASEEDNLDSSLFTSLSKNEHINAAINWLNLYFIGTTPDIDVTLNLNATPFQKEVWEITRSIPFGATTTYGDIARLIAKNRGIKSMSAQAVGTALGSNPLLIMIPCHRVIGADQSLKGYRAGTKIKQLLLDYEKEF